ncbi:MAG: IPT/TIG domain-containing protein [Chloroflexi bacterium]|nr:IPT/TIG domain-containing protein [Chloroflexota bacterium]
MKNGKILRLLSMSVLLPLLAVMIIGAPALAAPLITLSPENGAAGTTVTVIGENFDSYKGDSIYVFFDGVEMIGSPLTVPETGTFIFRFNIPDEAEPGGHTIRVKNEFTTLALSTFTVPETEISLDTRSGNIGARVTIEGKGFSADKVVTFFYDNGVKKILGTQPADSAGEFSFSFDVPESVGGQHQVSVQNTAGNYAEADFEVIPLIALGRTSGAIDEILTVSGNGFGHRTDVAVYFNNDEVAFAKTDDNGNFMMASFNVPPLPPGNFDVRVEDDDGNTAKAAFTIVAGASLDKASGSVGTEVLVAGTGFAPGGEVIVRYDDEALVTITADSDGRFEAAFKIPVSRYGEHTVVVTDGVTTRQLAFVMEEESPPVPGLRLPANASQVKAGAYFDWAKVTDASLPVSYHFQVASDTSFTTLVLDKKGLADSEYALAGAEKLPATSPGSPYYWRVKAADSAANESAWSSLWSFYVPAPPAPGRLLPETGIKAESEVLFKWERVSSLTPPVTYHLQVASDKNFASVVLEKQGMIKSEYTLTEEESLSAVKKEVPYYWRVRATDGAGNAGDWSVPGSFYIGFSFPTWLIFVLIGIAAVVVGFIAFLLGRRTAYYQSE